jgi:hypothetical protein
MAENIRPSTAGEIQQPLEVSEGSQAEGDINQNPSQGLPPPSPAMPDQPPANAHQQQTAHESRDGLSRARFIVEILTLGVLVWYTIITNGLWGEADQANRLNIKNSHLDQRAWVGVQEIHLPKVPTPREQLKFTIGIHNSGKTPGIRAVPRMAYSLTPLSGIDKFGFEPEIAGTRTFPPGEALYPVYLSIPKGGAASEQEVTRILDGALPIYIYGVIDYEDIFGEKHFTRFCAVYIYNKDDPTLLRWCEEKDYNYME